MANIQEIKGSNDLNIRQKTAPGSLTKEIIADAVDAGLDFTAQEAAKKQDKELGKGLISTTKEANIPADTNTELAGKLPITHDASGVTAAKIVNWDAAHSFSTASSTFTSAEKTKLGGIEAGAKGDQVAAEVPFTLYSDLNTGNVQGVIQQVRDLITAMQTGKADQTTVNTISALANTNKTDIATIQAALASDNTLLDTFQEVVDFIELNRSDLDSYVAALQNKVDKEVGKGLISTAKEAAIPADTNAALAGKMAASHAASGVTTLKIGNWDTAHSWGNHAGLYSLSTHNHAGTYEPVFTKNTGFNLNTGSTAGTVAAGNDTRILNGQTAFSWGNHASAGYLTTLPTHNHDSDYLPIPAVAGTNGQSLVTDGAGGVSWATVSSESTTYTTFTKSSAGLVPAPGGTTSTRFMREDGAWVIPTNTTYTTGTDTEFDNTASTTARLISGQRLNSWATRKGFLTSYTESDPVFSASPAGGITSTKITNWDAAYTWGNHAGLYSAAGHNHSGTYEPVFTKNTGFNLNTGTTAGTLATGNDSRILNGQTAYSWGNHASAGYLTTLPSVTGADYTITGGMFDFSAADIIRIDTSAGDITVTDFSNLGLGTVRVIVYGANNLIFNSAKITNNIGTDPGGVKRVLYISCDNAAAGNEDVDVNWVGAAAAPSAPDTTAPSAPQGVTVSNIQETSADASWTASTDN